MSKLLEGKVALITGAGRGIGREHALMMAEHGASIVVNDLGGDIHGEGGGATPAQETVAEIEAMGGKAVVNGGNVAKFDEAKAMIDQAIDTFGDIHIVVNNSGILRDRMLFSMTEDDWGAIMAVHLKGTFGPAPRVGALAGQAKAGEGSTAASSTPRRPPASTATSARPTTAQPRPASPPSR
ncbi:MAG: SDR family NAD(P)-dependent oxidoreductase [Acidimicrobiales bacterium]